MNYLGTNATEFGILTGIEMLTAIVCFIPTAHLADKYGREPFIVTTFIFFTLFPLSLFSADNSLGLTLAFVIHGLEEFGEPERKSLIIGLSPEPARARTIGAYYLIRDGVVTCGFFLGAWLRKISPQANFLGAALAGVVGTLYYLMSLKSEDRTS
jgi:MFS family permease